MSSSWFFRGVMLTCLVFAVSLANGQPPVVAVPSESSQPESVEPEKIVYEKTVYVPYEKLRKVFEQPGRGVFLPYDEFRELWDAARSARADQSASEVPVPLIISEMSATAMIAEEVVLVESTLQIDLLKDGWHVVPLRLHDVAITKALVDGRPARIVGGTGGGYGLLLEKTETERRNRPTPDADRSENDKADTATGEDDKPQPQRVELTLHFAKNIEKSPGRNSVSFDIPQAPMSRWKVVVPESGTKIDFAPLIAASESEKISEGAGPKPAGAAPDGTNEEAQPPSPSGQTVLVAFVGATPQVRIAWTPKAEGAAGLDALTSVQILQQTAVDEGILRTSARFDYSISRAAISDIAIRVPKDQKVVGVFDPNVRKWSVEPNEASQTIRIELFEPASVGQTVLLELERLFESSGEHSGEKQRFVIAVPELAAVGVGRQQGVLVVRSSDELSVETVKSSGLLRMDASELPESLRRPAPSQTGEIAYRISSGSYALELALDTVEPRMTAEIQVALDLSAGMLHTEVAAVLEISRAGIFQLSFDIPTETRDIAVDGLSAPGIEPVQVDSSVLAPPEENRTSRTLIVNFKRKAIGRVGLKISLTRLLDEPDLRSPTGQSVDVPIGLPALSRGIAERSDGKLLFSAANAFRLNPLDLDELQPVSIERICNADWRLSRKNAQLGFLFADPITSFKLRVERRKPQWTLREFRTVRIEDGSIRNGVRYDYEVLFSGVKSFRIDLPESVSGRLNLRGGDGWRDAMIVPQPEDVAAGYVAWDFSSKSELFGSGKLEFDWEDEMPPLEVGKSLPIDLPRLIPRKQQPSDRVWGQIVVIKSESIDLGQSDEIKGLKPIDPQHDVALENRTRDAVAAFEFHDDWALRLIATRYRLEEVKRTSIERGLVRANLFFTKQGSGIAAQALFRVRSVQQRLELGMPPGATISDVRINGQSTVLESDGTDQRRPRYMIALTSIPPDTPFSLDIRYSVEPPCRHRLEIPFFPGALSADGSTLSDSAVPAVQQVFLAVYLPDDRLPIGYQGPWSKEFEFRRSGNRIVAQNRPDVDLILKSFALPEDNFATVGKPFLFSSMCPREGDLLRLFPVGPSFGAIVFGAVFLLGIALLPVSWARRCRIVVGLIAVGVLLGFLWTTASSLLLHQSAVFWGVLIVALSWGLQAAVQCGTNRRRCREQAPQLPDGAAEGSPPNNASESAETTSSKDSKPETPVDPLSRGAAGDSADAGEGENRHEN